MRDSCASSVSDLPRASRRDRSFRPNRAPARALESDAILENYQCGLLVVNQILLSDSGDLEIYHSGVPVPGPYFLISERIRRAVADRGISQKELAYAVGMKDDALSRKLSKSLSSWKVEELFRIRDYFKYPEAWPFIDLERAEAIDLLQRFVAREKNQNPTEASPSPARPEKRKAGGGKRRP